jgi:DNA-binding transcriptional MerR regulator
MHRSHRSPKARLPDEASADERMSVEELARRTGTTVSNLRALQARKLLPPPTLQGRKALYTSRHQARVALLRRLQDRGYSLSAIADLLRGWERGAGLTEILELEDAVAAPVSPAIEQPSREVEVHRILPELLRDPKLLARAVDLELVVRRDDHLLAPNPELLDIARAHLRAGVPLAEILTEYGRMRSDAARTARRLRKLFDAHVFAPFWKAGAPAKDLPHLTQILTQLRPAAARAAAIAIAREIELGAPAAAVKPPRPRAATVKKRARPTASRRTPS